MSKKKKNKKIGKRIEVSRADLPNLRPSDILAITVSDIHLRITTPTARREEEDWLGAQKRPLQELKELKDHLQCPILFAGDLFDQWRSSPELVNYSLENLPHMYGIPGQHDLPFHRYNDIKKSAFWTVVYNKILDNIPSGKTIMLFNKANRSQIRVHSFPWNTPIKKLKKKQEGVIDVALIHEYCWIDKNKYTGADKKAELPKFKKALKNYDFAVFGDNHLGFIADCGNTKVINNGAFQRTKKDQEAYSPFVGLLMVDGSIKKYLIDTTHDKFVDYDKDLVTGFSDNKKDAESFIEELKALEDNEFSFKQKIEERKKELKKNVYKLAKQIIQELENEE